MDRFKCDRCEKQFARQAHLQYHLGKTKLCEKVGKDSDTHKCDKCGKIYTQRSNLSRHQKKCEGNKTDKERILELEKIIANMNKKPISTKKTVNDYNSPDLLINNFYDLRGDIPGIMSELTRKYLPTKLPSLLLEKIYFNDDMKKNWSIMIHEEKFIYFEDGCWKTDDKSKMVNMMAKKIYTTIINNLKLNVTLMFPTAEPELKKRYNTMLDELNSLNSGKSAPDELVKTILHQSKKIYDWHKDHICF